MSRLILMHRSGARPVEMGATCFCRVRLLTRQGQQVVGPVAVSLRPKVLLAVRRSNDMDVDAVPEGVLHVRLAVLHLDPIHDLRAAVLAGLGGCRVRPPEADDVLVPRTTRQQADVGNLDGHIGPSFCPQRLQALVSSAMPHVRIPLRYAHMTHWYITALGVEET